MSVPDKIELSIIIPTINSSQYIHNTVFEVHQFLTKNISNFEIIIINDYSNDSTFEELLKLKLLFSNLIIINLKTRHYQRQATSIGYKIAKGKYVISYDDDLQYSTENISIVYNTIKNDSTVSILSGYYHYPKQNEQKNIYYYNRLIVLFLFNYIFFYKYRSCKYFSSFKIFNKEKLSKIRDYNIFHFWTISYKVIKPIKINKIQKQKVRKSNYKLYDYWIFFDFIFYKIIQKTSYFLGVCSLILFQNAKIFLFFLIIFILTIFLLMKDKNINSKDYDIY